MSERIDFTLEPSPQAWLEAVMRDFPKFLQDHAACERKASATCLSFVVKYRDKPELIETMIRLAREELEHFDDVCRLLRKIGVELGPDEKDPYIMGFKPYLRNHPEWVLLDRLVVGAIVERRGAERFARIADALATNPDWQELAPYYAGLAKDEDKHFHQYLKIAQKYYSSHIVRERTLEIAAQESQIMNDVPPRAALH